VTAPTCCQGRAQPVGCPQILTCQLNLIACMCIHFQENNGDKSQEQIDTGEILMPTNAHASSHCCMPAWSPVAVSDASAAAFGTILVCYLASLRPNCVAHASHALLQPFPRPEAITRAFAPMRPSSPFPTFLYIFSQTLKTKHRLLTRVHTQRARNKARQAATSTCSHRQQLERGHAHPHVPSW